jgi:hypothetical protein
MVAANLWHLGWVHMQWQQPNNHPLCHSCGATVLLFLQHKLAFCSSFKLTIPRASSTQHPPSSVLTMLDPEWFFKPHTKAYNTPSNGNFYFQVQQSLSEYLNMITSSPLFQESTHLGVAPALCSTLGTTPYFSVSLPLLVSRVQVALPFNQGTAH